MKETLLENRLRALENQMVQNMCIQTAVTTQMALQYRFCGTPHYHPLQSMNGFIPPMQQPMNVNYLQAMPMCNRMLIFTRPVGVFNPSYPINIQEYIPQINAQKVYQRTPNMPNVNLQHNIKHQTPKVQNNFVQQQQPRFNEGEIINSQQAQRCTQNRHKMNDTQSQDILSREQ